MQTPLTFFFAFVAVLVLIGAVAWLVRRFAGNRLGGNASRGRMPRLAVIDAAAVDGRRRLVLVRRDNVEHLLMIGGPSDIVVEPNIVRAVPTRDQVSPRPNIGAEPLPRATHFPDEEVSHLDRFEPPEPALPEPPVRSARPSFADELRRPSAPPPLPPLPERRHDPLATISPEPLTRPEPRPDLRAEPALSRAPRNESPLSRPPLRASESPLQVKAPPVRPEPAPAAAPPAPSDLASADQNLAEMAKRLEAALRRPAAEARPATGEPQPGAQPETPPVRPSPRVTSDAAPSTPAPPSAAPPVAPPSPKGDFENLEDEMASLLGRPKTPS
jgi:flagellar biogenesis protein FliO